MLAKLDDPEIEYNYWVGLGKDFPAELCHFKGVNLEDENQVNGFLMPLFSRNKRVVDFYLSQVVFPREAREFPSKLPTSAWDLVEERANITTGFSGTNDNRLLLPTSISQEDRGFALDTNALVLHLLLLPQNDHYECTEGGNGERELTTAFLERLVRQDPEIRVLLDVGAQMLELRNEELARHWLSLRPDVLAAIFFDDSDHLTVITPDGIIEPFISSPFNQQLERCVVYLDDAHTRGTDLDFPKGTRAAVTLGLNVTKDRLVQGKPINHIKKRGAKKGTGCMRMRQLGKGHSVMFFVPGEVDRRIRGLIPNGTVPGARIRVVDIIRWAIHETCEEIRHYLPYWAHQGIDYHKRFAAYEEYRSTGDLDVLRSAWQQPESRTLEEMYWIPAGTKMAWSHDVYSIPALCERIEWLGCTKLVNVRVAEEQEREVNHEVDPEYSIANDRKHPRLPTVQPAEHIIHAEIREFVETGKLPESPTHIFSLMAPINMAEAMDSTIGWSPTPLASADFTTTTHDSDGVALTEFLRPVNWILSSGSGRDSIVIVISPYEANELLPTIRKSSKVRLHIYAPRVTFSMQSFSDLTFYSIPNSLAEPWSAPAHVRTELNLFAGQLFFDNKAEYERACVLLGLSKAHPGAEKVELDGFVLPVYRTGKSSPFSKSKIPILEKLIELRQKGKGYHRTHLGQILSGKPLCEETL